MKQFFKDKRKLMLVSVFMLLTLVACKSVRNADGSIIQEAVIGLDTSFKQTLSSGWFDGLIVWPISQLINFIAQYSDAGIAIIIVTILINIVTSVFTIKSQVSAQKMQMLQPEMQKIQNKYANNKDQRSQMMMAQEMQKLYSEHNISPFGSIIVMFLQLPIIFGMYQATMRASSVINGTFMGINLESSPMAGMQSGQVAYVIIFVAMIVAQIVSMKFPQWIQKYRKKHSNVKEKAYAQPEKKSGGMAGSMNMMMYMSTFMIAFLGINWPLGMSFYWLVSSLTRIVQNIVIYKYFIKD